MISTKAEIAGEEFMSSHQFTSIDLEANRKGKLSVGQRKKLQKKLLMPLLAITLWPIFVMYGWVISLRSANMVGEIMMFCLTLGIVFPVKFVVALWKDLKGNNVEKKTGFVRISLKHAIKGPPNIVYFCQNFEINSVPPGAKMDTNKIYTVYFLKHSKHFLSLETASLH